MGKKPPKPAETLQTDLRMDLYQHYAPTKTDHARSCGRTHAHPCCDFHAESGLWGGDSETAP